MLTPTIPDPLVETCLSDDEFRLLHDLPPGAPLSGRIDELTAASLAHTFAAARYTR